MKKVILVVAYLICAVFNYGSVMGSFTHDFPYEDNRAIALLMALAGPAGLPADLIDNVPFHWQLKNLSTEQRWEVFHQKYPELSKDYFERKFN